MCYSCCLVTEWCQILWPHMDCSKPGFPVLHCLLEFAQTHVHWVSDAIHPSHSLLPLLHLPSIFPSIMVFSNDPALYIKWPKYWNFIFSLSPSNEYTEWFLLGLTGLISLQCKGLSRAFSSTTVWKHQFFGDWVA